MGVNGGRGLAAAGRNQPAQQRIWVGPIFMHLPDAHSGGEMIPEDFAGQRKGELNLKCHPSTAGRTFPAGGLPFGIEDHLALFPGRAEHPTNKLQEDVSLFWTAAAWLWLVVLGCNQDSTRRTWRAFELRMSASAWSLVLRKVSHPSIQSLSAHPPSSSAALWSQNR